MSERIIEWGDPSSKRSGGHHTITVRENGELVVEWEHDEVGGHSTTISPRRARQVAKVILEQGGSK
ncbi:MAG: hypothetical protein KGI89_02930 [Euryarchaeota archaeon]|nr:hypothetical protein [Euryarchaeota archaeon]